MSKQELTDAQLLSTPTESLDRAQLERRMALVQLRKAEREADVVEAENQKHLDAKEERARHASTMRQLLAQENEKTELTRKRCKHKSGGKGYAGFFSGDGRMGYVLSRQKLPLGNVYVICLRCQVEFHKADKGAVVNYYRNLDPLKPKMSFQEYQRQNREYIWAMTRETPLTDIEGGDVAGSCQFSVPWVNKQREKDAEEFAALLAEKGWTENADTEQELSLR